MSYQLFEGKIDVRTVKKPEDVESFQKIKRRLKFERDIDLIVFCASIGLYRCEIKKSDEKTKKTSLVKLTTIPTFDRARLFDFIVLTFLKIEGERMHEFESYFYTGFKILEEWFQNNDGNMNNTLERFSTIINDLLTNK